MATLSLLPQRSFEITLNTGEKITGKFGTYALALYQNKLAKSPEVSESNIFTVTAILLCAVQQSCRENKKPFDFTDFDACAWIDELEGMEGEDCTALFAHLSEKKSVTTADPEGQLA